MPYSFITASRNLRKVSITLLLFIQLLCALASAFNLAPVAGETDIHHAGYNLLVPDHAEVAASSLAADDAHQHGCDHCSHCHASHTGLFKAAVAVAVEPDVQPDFYLSHIPLLAQSGIYRPPIA
ncbi:hypothetical protein [Rheinheimera gaetbuli]